MSWEHNSPIKFKLGSVAIWNRLSRKTVDMRDGVLAFLHTNAPEQFEDLIKAPLPATMKRGE